MYIESEKEKMIGARQAYLRVEYNNRKNSDVNEKFNMVLNYIEDKVNHGRTIHGLTISERNKELYNTISSEQVQSLLSELGFKVVDRTGTESFSYTYYGYKYYLITWGED